MIRAIFIDLDDTLIATQSLYDRSIKAFAQHLGKLGVDQKVAEQQIRRNSADLFPQYGYSTERMPKAFEMALDQLVPDAGKKHYKIARRMANRIFRSVAKPYLDAAVGMAMLSKHFKIHLVTQGHAAIQQKRIKEMPFSDLIDTAHIVSEKKADVFKKLIADLGYKPSEVVMIGDSLKSDIIPARQAGMHALLIPRKNWKTMEHDGYRANRLDARVYQGLDSAAAVLVLEKIKPLIASLIDQGEIKPTDSDILACYLHDTLGGYIGGHIVCVQNKAQDRHYFNRFGKGIDDIDMFAHILPHGVDISNAAPDRHNFSSTRDHLLSCPVRLDRYYKMARKIRVLIHQQSVRESSEAAPVANASSHGRSSKPRGQGSAQKMRHQPGLRI